MYIKRLLSLLLGVTLILGSFAVFSLSGFVFAGHDPFNGLPQTNVSLCHSTSSPINPYTNPTVSISSSGAPQGGHDNDPDDIIPPYHWVDGSGVTQSYPGKNWTDDNQEIWENGCVEPESSPTPSPTITPSPTPTDSPSPTPTESPSPTPSDNPSPTPSDSPTPTPTPTDEQTEEPTPTPSPVLGTSTTDVCANIDGDQTSVPDGLHLDASGLNCVAFSVPGPGGPGDGGAVLGASTTGGQVLGASTLGEAGTASQKLIFLLSLGMFLLGSGIIVNVVFKAKKGEIIVGQAFGD